MASGAIMLPPDPAGGSPAAVPFAGNRRVLTRPFLVRTRLGERMFALKAYTAITHLPAPRQVPPVVAQSHI
jgi:hypothetical protein